MDDRDFIRELIARPNDEALRLAYADWLEERGDPGAQYLRTEIELATLKPDDERYGSLQFRLQSLRRRCHPRWVAKAGQRYDLQLYTFPTAQIPAAVARLGELGVMTHLSARFKLCSLPSLLLSRVQRDLAEDVGRELERVAGREEASPGLKFRIILSREIT